MTDGDHHYWDGVAADPDELPPGWRRRARTEHLDLFRTWVGELAGRWLKTDLFEERSPDRALLPWLPGAAWVGVDLSPAVCAGARRASATDAVAADVRALPFADATFDGVLSTSTLDHFDDVEEIDRSLVEIRRVLRPGGRLLLTLDNRGNPMIRARNALPPDIARRTGLVPFAVGATHDLAGGLDALGRTGYVVEESAHLLHAPHVVGTRPARWAWYEHRVLPRFAALAHTRLARRTGHYVAYSAVRPD